SRILGACEERPFGCESAVAECCQQWPPSRHAETKLTRTRARVQTTRRRQGVASRTHNALPNHGAQRSQVLPSVASAAGTLPVITGAEFVPFASRRDSQKKK